MEDIAFLSLDRSRVVYEPGFSLDSSFSMTLLAPRAELFLPGLVASDDFVPEGGEFSSPLDEGLLSPLDPFAQAFDLLVETSDLFVLCGECSSERPILLAKEIGLAGLGSKSRDLRLQLCVPLLDCLFDLVVGISEDLMFGRIGVRY